MDPMDIGFIGLGNMGTSMAVNLLRAGHHVTVYNRSPAKAEPLIQQGAAAARTIGEACSSEVVFTMLADDQAVESVTFGDNGLLASLTPGATHVSASTISVALSQRLATTHAQAGQQYVAAPVFGRPQAAAAAELLIVTAGAPQVLQPLMTLFDIIGQRTFVVSDQPHIANLVKLSGNFLVASAIETVAEAVALVAKAGVDRQQYVDILTSTLFNSPVYRTYGELIAQQKFEPAAFAATLGLKDVRLVLAAAEDLQVPLPIASVLRDRLLTLVATGGGNLDWTAVATLADRDAGASSRDPA